MKWKFREKRKVSELTRILKEKVMDKNEIETLQIKKKSIRESTL